jgi:hypothetical protein
MHDADGWHAYSRLTFQRIILIDGTAPTSLRVIRRRVGGEWHYRKLTRGEMQEELESDGLT